MPPAPTALTPDPGRTAAGAASGRVDVIIATYNARALLVRCLERLNDAAIGRIIVVDDVSSDDTVTEIRRLFPRVVVVALPEHRGLSYAWNRGAELADGEFLLFLNNDVFVVDDAVTRLAQALAADPQAASAGGRLVDPVTHRTQDSYRPRSLPGLAALIARLVGIERHWPSNPWTGQHLRTRLSDDATVRTDAQPAGGCLLVERGAFDAVGGWDERFWIWYEDVDMSRRLLEQAGPALYVPQAVFEHVGGASTGGWRRHEHHRRLYHGTVQYAAAHFGRARRAAFGSVVIAVALPRVLLLSDTEARGVYRQVLRAGAALVANREPPSLFRSQRRRVDSVGEDRDRSASTAAD